LIGREQTVGDETKKDAMSTTFWAAGFELSESSIVGGGEPLVGVVGVAVSDIKMLAGWRREGREVSSYGMVC
jgi:hypothetical protein